MLAIVKPKLIYVINLFSRDLITQSWDILVYEGKLILIKRYGEMV